MSRKKMEKENCAREESTNDENRTYLRIVLQPQERFRYRYTTESEGKGRVPPERTPYSTQHGALRGRCHAEDNRIKGQPKIELVNYAGKARIKCDLAQYDNDEEHPFKLADGEGADVSHVVPHRGSYAIGFPGLTIISVTKEDVHKWVERRLHERGGNAITKEQVESARKNINLKKVRLKFSAHDVNTDAEICDAVFSEPICNSRCPETNNLKIFNMSHYCGSSAGSTPVLMFVSKVNKSNIEIWFIERSDNGEKVWSARAGFLPNDVHYQYGIKFNTPAYWNPRSPRNVKVDVELRRPSDGATSDPVSYTYTADPVPIESKKRKFPELPDLSTLEIQPREESLTVPSIINQMNTIDDPMWAQSNIEYPTLCLNEAPSTSNAVESLPFDLGDNIVFPIYDDEFSIRDWVKWSPDSGRGTGSQPSSSSLEKDSKPDTVRVKQEKSDYDAFYTVEEGAEVKRLVKELCDVVRNRKDHTKQDIRNIMEQLFDIRLSNGDTFLHMALQNDNTSFEYIVKLLHSVQMTFILDLANDKQQTILHYAVAKNMPDTVALLISKGCNPMLKDHEENNAVHYAVRCQPCLVPLLEAIKKNDVACDLNTCNIEKQSPLHWAAIYDCGQSAGALLTHGASYNVRDTHGRTPLHLAAYDDKLRCARALLDFITPEDIDVVDGYGNTALQIVCGVTMRQNSTEMVKLLLDRKADPMKHEDRNKSAWRLARNKPEILAILEKHVYSQKPSLDDNSDDEYLSADELDT